MSKLGEPITRKWVNCKCRLSEYLHGQGCETCNPEYWKQHPKEVEVKEEVEVHPFMGPWFTP